MGGGGGSQGGLSYKRGALGWSGEGGWSLCQHMIELLILAEPTTTHATTTHD